LRNELRDEVIITIIAPPSVNTQMREHSVAQFAPKKNIEFNEDDSKKMSVEVRIPISKISHIFQECTSLIVEAIDSKKRNVILTFSGKLAVMLKPFFPTVIDYITNRKTGGSVNSKLLIFSNRI
jgi:hypothetical protein